MPKPMPFLWFDKNAEEAAKFYVSVFPNSRITSVSPMTVSFVLDGQEFAALNGGPAHANFNESISFVVTCRNQKEIDGYWEKLTRGGGESRCGWLKDRYGLSWQVVPEGIGEMLKSATAQQALLGMTKIEIDKLK